MPVCSFQNYMDSEAATRTNLHGQDISNFRGYGSWEHQLRGTVSEGNIAACRYRLLAHPFRVFDSRYVGQAKFDFCRGRISGSGLGRVCATQITVLTGQIVNCGAIVSEQHTR
jgi:hypothetical protein